LQGTPGSHTNVTQPPPLSSHSLSRSAPHPSFPAHPQDTIDELQEKLQEAEAKLLRSLEDVDVLNFQLNEASEKVVATEAAAQQQVLALKQQMAAREQEIVAEKLAGC
jgi:hypothetical protein